MDLKKTDRVVGIIVFISVVLLLFSFFTEAVSVYFTGLNTDIDKGENISFNALINLNTNERIPLDNLSLQIQSMDSDYYYSCNFSVYGQNLSGCSNITIAYVQNPDLGYGYGYLFGYGYGYNNESGTWDYSDTNSSFNYGYMGYGYGYNLSNMFYGLAYAFNWTTPNITENLSFSIAANAYDPYSGKYRTYENEDIYYLNLNEPSAPCFTPTNTSTVPQGIVNICPGYFLLNQQLNVSSDTDLRCNDTNLTSTTAVFRTVDADNVSVSGCRIEYSDIVLFANNSVNVTFRNNTIINTTAVYSVNSSTEILDNLAYNVTYFAYLINNSNDNISGNMIFGNDFRAFYIASTTDSILSDNHIESNDGTRTGIFITGSDRNNITGNYVYNSSYGIYLIDSEYNSVSGNNATMCYYGIYASLGGHNAFENNQIINYSDYGILLGSDQYGSEVINNTLNTSYGTSIGIAVSSSQNANLSYNTINSTHTNILIAGDSTFEALSFNNLYLANTTVYHIEMSGQSRDVNASHNYYESLGQISSYVYDSDDDNSLGTYNYYPYLVEPYGTDSNGPEISFVNPSNNSVLAYGTTSAVINITTDEHSYCRYSNDSNFSYSDGSNFTDSNPTWHSFTVSGLTNGGSYDYFYKCMDIFGNNKSSAHHFSVSATEPSSGGSSGGGGSGGSGSASYTPSDEKTYRFMVRNIEANEIETVKTYYVELTNLSFSPNKDISTLNVVVRLRSQRPTGVSSPSGRVYKYIVVEHKEITNEDINEAWLEFKVEREWISGNISDVVLMRYVDGKWIQLRTEVTKDTLGTVYYKAYSPGLSYFAIGEKQGTGSQDGNNVSDASDNEDSDDGLNTGDDGQTNVVSNVTTIKEDDYSFAGEAEKESSSVSFIIFIALLVILGIVAFVAREEIGVILYVIKTKGYGKKQEEYEDIRFDVSNLNLRQEDTQTSELDLLMAYDVNEMQRQYAEHDIEDPFELDSLDEIDPFDNPVDEQNLQNFILKYMQQKDSDINEMYKKLLCAGWSKDQIKYIMDRFRR